MEVFFVKNGYTIYLCPSCGLRQTDLRKNYKEFVESHYNKGYFSGDPTRSAYVDYKTDKPHILKNMRWFLRRIETYKAKGKLLDVGCAFGFFVELARDKGFDAYGFDPSLHAVTEAKRLVGPERIKLGTIDSISYPKKSFDVITMFDVFEHLQDPGGDIAKLNTYLKDDGIILIATGNTASLMEKILKRRWTFYIPPQHLFFFNKATMSALLAKYNLRVVEWFSIGKWLSLRYVLHLARTTGESRLAHHLYPLMQKWHVDNVPLFFPAVDNMVAVVQKKG